MKGQLDRDSVEEIEQTSIGEVMVLLTICRRISYSGVRSRGRVERGDTTGQRSSRDEDKVSASVGNIQLSDIQQNSEKAILLTEYHVVCRLKMSSATSSARTFHLSQQTSHSRRTSQEENVGKPTRSCIDRDCLARHVETGGNPDKGTGRSGKSHQPIANRDMQTCRISNLADLALNVQHQA